MALPFFGGEMRDAASPWLKKAPADVLSRQSRRGTTSLESRRELEDGDQFVCTGTDGDEYVVAIGLGSKSRLSCSCPDKVTPCKHIWFVYLDVLGLAKTDPLTWQAALTPKEVLKLLPRLDPARPKKRATPPLAEASENQDEDDTKQSEYGQPTKKKLRRTDSSEAYDDEQSEAVKLLRQDPSKASDSVLDTLCSIVSSIRSDATTDVSDARRSAALLALVAIALESTESPVIDENPLLGAATLDAVNAILKSCGASLEESVLARVERMVRELSMFGIDDDIALSTVQQNREAVGITLT